MLDFYFDFISPFGYFASLRIDELGERYGRAVQWNSFLIGITVIKVMGMKPLLETPLKGDYIRRDAMRYVRRHGVPWGRPIDAPMANPLAAGRAFWWLKTHAPAQAKPAARAIFRAYWADGVDISPPETVADIAAPAGVDRTALLAGMTEGDGPALLREAVDRALSRGVFGSPFFIVDGEPFFGVEKMELLEDWLRNGGW